MTGRRVRRVVQSGGRITFESEPGHGTVFHILLPQVEDAPVAVPESTQLEQPVDGAHARILLVEDEPMVRALTRKMLERAGYSVVEAVNGAAALVHLEGPAGDVDLVISDVVMPEAGGGALMRAMRSRDSDIPVIFMSGDPTDSAVAAAIGDAECALLAKPFTPSQLLVAVRETLDRAGRTARDLPKPQPIGIPAR
jgi:two-component system cell cycle sensor histidine kinase/response regulator CckA